MELLHLRSPRRIAFARLILAGVGGFLALGASYAIVPPLVKGELGGTDVIVGWTITVFAVAALLMGCGFRPLYGSGDAAETENELAAIQVRPIDDRIGQVLHNHLLDLLNPRGQPRHPKYKLDVRLRESIARLGVEKSELATRANLRITASFILLSSGDSLMFHGQSVTISSFNILGSDDLATLVAEKDARARAVRQIASDLQGRLAAFFLQRQPRKALKNR